MIKFQNVVKRFDNFIALDNIDLEINKGSAYGLLGSNGAGKSTILRLISGIYSAENGTVEIDGERVFDNAHVKEKVFFVNDETVQFGDFTLDELSQYSKMFYPNYSDDKFEELWEILKLPRKNKLASFSKGMKRQAIVICALASQPDYLLLDEAFDGLDPTMRIIVKRMIVDAMVDNQMTVVISSHNLKEIDEFCDTVGLLHKGKIVFNRDLDSVKGNVHKVQTAFDKEYREDDFDDLELLHFDKRGSVVYLIVKGSEDEITTKLNKMEPKILDIIPLSLEEVFIYEMEGLGYEYSSIEG
ncbi:MAG: ABC transporter ATP-binding protein [Clostridiales bacterium]|nr:ABC transporter ATP-binding protein [Clostridiales bacterium]